MLTTHSAGRVSFLNREAERLTGYRSVEAVGQSAEAVLGAGHQDPGESVGDWIALVLRRGDPSVSHRRTLHSRTGDALPVEGIAAPIQRADGSAPASS